MNHHGAATNVVSRPVHIGELAAAWLAVQRGDFRTSGLRRPVTDDTATESWQPAQGELPIVVAGCAGSVGASTVALLLASAGAGRVVECAPSGSSGLAGAATAELGEIGDGWIEGRREGTLVQRRRDNPDRPDAIPVPLSGQPGGVTVVDCWWPFPQLLAGSGWLADLARGCPRIVLAARVSIPAMQQLETHLGLAGADRCWVVAAGVPSRRWPKPAEHAMGPLTRRLRDEGRVVTLPHDPGLAVTGVTTEPLPRSFEPLAAQLLKGLLP